MKKLNCLLVALVIVAVSSIGFALFFTSVDRNVLTTSINSFWDIKIMSIDVEETNGSAYDKGAYINNNHIILIPHLEKKGDSISYIININNNGNIDGILNDIESSYRQDDLIIEYNNISIGENLNKRESKLFTIKVSYNNDYGEVIEPNRIVIDLDYIQN